MQHLFLCLERDFKSAHETCKNFIFAHSKDVRLNAVFSYFDDQFPSTTVYYEKCLRPGPGLS